MPHVEVDHILCVGALDRDSKGLKGMEGKGNQTSNCVIYWSSQQACLDFKFQKPRVTSIKPGGGEENK